MGPAISLRDVGVKFRDARQGRRGRNIPRLLGKGSPPFWGIRHVSFDIGHGEVVGLIGPNGSGKTTLLRTIAGIYTPDEGETRVEGRVGPMLSASAGLEPGLSGWDNIELSAILLGLTRAEAAGIGPEVARLADIERFMGAPVRVYSAGMKARLGFAIAVTTNPDVLVLDEIITVGDQEFRDRSGAKIQELMEAGKTVIVASHDVAGMTEMCDRLARLERGRLVEIGDPAEVAERYVADHGAHVRRQPKRLRVQRPDRRPRSAAGRDG